MQPPIAAYGSVVSVLISLLVAGALVRRKGVNLKTVSFAICVFFMAVWVLTETFYHFVGSEEVARLMITIGFSSTALMSTALIIFMLSFWKEDRRLFTAIAIIGVSISLIPFAFPQGQELVTVGEVWMSFVGPVYFWIGLPYAALAYMGTSIFLLWVSRDIKGSSKRRIHIVSSAFLLQYPVSSLSYIYGQLTGDPLICSIVQSLTLPFTLIAIFYALVY